MKEKLFNPVSVLIVTMICFLIAFIDIRLTYAQSIVDMSIFGKIGTIGFILGFIWILCIIFLIPLIKKILK